MHNLRKTKANNSTSNEFLEPVAQISGRDAAVARPQDRDRIVNNVIRPFRAESERDRAKATEILDYIVRKRNESTARVDK